MYHYFFIHSSVYGHLGCFHVLAIVNSAAKNNGIHVSLSILVSSGYNLATWFKELTRKDPDAGKDWRLEKKGTAEDEMIGWHHRLDGHEFEQALGVSDRQGGLACWSPWERKMSDKNKRLIWNDYRAIPLLCIYPEETIIEKDTCIPLFISALFTIARTWKQPRYPSTYERIKKLWYIYTMEY